MNHSIVYSINYCESAQRQSLKQHKTTLPSYFAKHTNNMEATKKQLKELKKFVKEEVCEGGSVKPPYYEAIEEVKEAINNMNNPPPYTDAQINAVLDKYDVGPNTANTPSHTDEPTDGARDKNETS